MKHLWKNYNLSIVLGILFLFAWVLQTWTGWVHFAGEQQQHGQTAQWFGEDGYIWQWTAATMENWQSEFLQLLTFVVLTACLVHKGSHESKDTDEEMMKKLDAILDRVERLESASYDSRSSNAGQTTLLLK
jgi:hypothetical protein